MIVKVQRKDVRVTQLNTEKDGRESSLFENGKASPMSGAQGLAVNLLRSRNFCSQKSYEIKNYRQHEF